VLTKLLLNGCSYSQETPAMLGAILSCLTFPATKGGMQRRDFIALLGATLARLTGPSPLNAQQPARPVVGFLSSTSKDGAEPYIRGLYQGLAEAGFTGARNTAFSKMAKPPAGALLILNDPNSSSSGAGLSRWPQIMPFRHCIHHVSTLSAEA
jgi:hypothetical protein